MTPEEARRIVLAAEARAACLGSRVFRPHVRTPKQAAFGALTTPEAFYGGAAGGGKTDVLLDIALEDVHIPGYAALCLRRTFPELEREGGLIPRAHQWLNPTRAHWNGDLSRWTFPSGASISFGHMQHEKNKYDYDGSEYIKILFDELTHFLSTQYLYVHSRLRRTTDFPIEPYSRSAGSPSGVGHKWVKERFIKTPDPERPFIPALLTDNPHIDQKAYTKKLQLLPEITRRQLLYGEWILDHGGLVYPFDDQNLIEDLDIEFELDLHKALAIDLGASENEASTAFCVMGYHDHAPTTWVLHSEANAGMIPTTIAERIMMLQEEFGWFETIVIDEGALGKGYSREFQLRHKIPCIAAEKHQKLAFRNMLQGYLEAHEVFIVRPRNTALIDEMSVLQWNDERTDNLKGTPNHLTDTLLYAWRATKAYTHEPQLEEPERGTKEWYQAEAERMEAQAIEEAEREAYDLEDREDDWWMIKSNDPTSFLSPARYEQRASRGLRDSEW